MYIYQQHHPAICCSLSLCVSQLLQPNMIAMRDLCELKGKRQTSSHVRFSNVCLRDAAVKCNMSHLAVQGALLRPGVDWSHVTWQPGSEGDKEVCVRHDEGATWWGSKSRECVLTFWEPRFLTTGVEPRWNESNVWWMTPQCYEWREYREKKKKHLMELFIWRQSSQRPHP